MAAVYIYIYKIFLPHIPSTSLASPPTRHFSPPSPVISILVACFLSCFPTLYTLGAEHSLSSDFCLPLLPASSPASSPATRGILSLQLCPPPVFIFPHSTFHHRRISSLISVFFLLYVICFRSVRIVKVYRILLLPTEPTAHTPLRSSLSTPRWPERILGNNTTPTRSPPLTDCLHELFHPRSSCTPTLSVPEDSKRRYQTRDIKQWAVYLQRLENPFPGRPQKWTPGLRTVPHGAMAKSMT